MWPHVKRSPASTWVNAVPPVNITVLGTATVVFSFPFEYSGVVPHCKMGGPGCSEKVVMAQNVHSIAAGLPHLAIVIVPPAVHCAHQCTDQ